MGEKRATEGQSKGKPSAFSQRQWQEVTNLLSSGRYRDAAKLLKETEASANANGDHALATVLNATRHICLAGNDFRAEINHHRQAYTAATEREKQLRGHLQTLANIIAARMVLPDREASVTLSPDPSARPQSEIPGLLERLRNLLGGTRGSKSSDPDLSPSDATDPMLEPAEPESTANQDLSPSTVPEKSLPSTASRPAPRAEMSDDRPSLTVYCLGPFQLYQDDEPVQDWPSGKGKSVFKYLVTHRGRPVAKEVLMDLFWPDSAPDAARNSLNVAIYGLRQALRQSRPNFHHVLFEDDHYHLNRELHVWVDAEEFRQRLSAARKLDQQGDIEAAVRLYSACDALYRGEFLAEDRYEEWVIPYRRSLRDDCLELLEQLSRHYLRDGEFASCITFCEKMLVVEPCREDAHRQLMRAYSRQDQRYLALRQYHACLEALERELGVEPSRRTVELYEKVRRREPT